ncbi:MAG: hypothetical protein GEU97_24060 [Actinophytocola sp.]|nr:hypothetical protein [Actinophytocola sp.]
MNARRQNHAAASGDTETTEDRPSGLHTVVDGRSVKSWIAIAAAIAIVVLGFGAWWTYGLDRGTSPQQGMPMAGMDQDMGDDMGGDMGGMGGDMAGMAADVPRFPPVAAYYGGEQVFFAHTETSDPEISQTLTDMMGSPVVTVPELAQTPPAALGPVYVFTNGVKPDGPRGPMGFQPDVFDTAPGDPGYTPLRQLIMLTWVDDAEPRVLTSAGHVEQAINTGQLTAERTDVVINAPLLTWPDGQR